MDRLIMYLTNNASIQEVLLFPQKRHGDHRRNQVRRQRHAWRAGCQPHRRRLPDHSDRPKGLYTADPRKDPTATLVSEARAGDPALEAMAAAPAPASAPAA